jgi:hypothetical protein
MMIQNCVVDAEKLAILSECTDTYGMENRDPENEWVWNLISRKTVVYSGGSIGREGETLKHNHDPAEMELCQKLAQEAAAIMDGQLIDLGDEGEHGFSPFYVVANDGQDAPELVNEAVIRSAFGGAIYPDAKITIEPLEKPRDLWMEKVDLYGMDEYKGNAIKYWEELTTWFRSQASLQNAVFVSVDTNDMVEDERGLDLCNGGCVLPRLAVGLTNQGSLVGVFSCVVYT